MSLPRASSLQRSFALAEQPGGRSPQFVVAGESGVHLELVTVIVDDYDEAIDFFVETVAFELVEDTPSTTDDGRPKRWVVVRPPSAQTGILLAQADGARQRRSVGEPRDEPYGRIVVFDVAANRWYLLGPLSD